MEYLKKRNYIVSILAIPVAAIYFIYPCVATFIGIWASIVSVVVLLLGLYKIYGNIKIAPKDANFQHTDNNGFITYVTSKNNKLSIKSQNKDLKIERIS